jgi:hypothetical protein
MATGNSFATNWILEAFSQEIGTQGGSIRDTFDDGERLFIRSVLPGIEQVQRDDRLQGGVALKAFADEIMVYPYIFRLVCSNGAIMAHTVASRRLSILVDQEQEATVADLCEAVRACCAADVFGSPFEQMLRARDVVADPGLSLLSMLSRLSGGSGTGVLQQIMRRFFESGDRSRFGLMNAVTSVARDTADPAVRWNLEELGGGIPMDAVGPTPHLPMRDAIRRRREVLVST